MLPFADDPVLQDGPVPQAPGPQLSFEGLGNADNQAVLGFTLFPPDTVGDVGPNHYVQWINLVLAVWDKSGNLLYGPVAGNTLWQGFGGPCETNNDGDVLVVYDQLADRWVLSQFALAADGHQCIAVSQTPDPLGAYHLYDYVVSPGGLNDYPKIGVWPDGYYVTINEFVGFGFNGSAALAFDRESMLQGLPAAMVRFELNDPAGQDQFFALQPAHMEGRTPPPPGTPNFIVQAFDDEVASANPDATQDSYKIWAFSPDWTDPGASTFTGPVTVPTAEFATGLCESNREECVPQPDTDQQLEALSQFTMYRLVYRNFGDHDALVGNHTVAVDDGGRAGVRWVEMRDLTTMPVVHNTGTFAPDDGNYRWMGSANMDASGNLAVGYSVSGPDTFPSIRYAARLADDPPGVLGFGEGELHTGTASQTAAGRWGDYSALSIDETDDCTFWYTTEYFSAEDPTNWRTRIATFSLPTCNASGIGRITGTVVDQDGAPIAGATIRAGAFTTVTADDGTYRLTVVEGTYDVTASKFGYGVATISDVEVVDGQEVVVDFTLEEAETVAVRGFVYDGGAAGWPLYAEVLFTAQGSQPIKIFTDPETGYYSAELYAGAEYTVRVTSLVPGYVAETRPIVPGPGDTTANFALEVNLGTCEAPGYELEIEPLLSENFDGGIPVDWSTEEESVGCTNGNPGWNTVDPAARGNLTGGEGLFAIADSDACGPGSTMDARLISEPLDLSEFGANQGLQIEFNQDFFSLPGSTAMVDVWNGTEWVTIDTQTQDARGPATRTVGTSAANGQAEAKFRFRFTTNGWHWWWQVDDVNVERTSCEFTRGGLVFGNVYDENTSEAVNGATVSVLGGDTVVTTATPDDANIDDGFYITFASGASTITATAPNYGEVTSFVIPQINGAKRKDFVLPAGLLTVDPAEVFARVTVGESSQEQLALINSGGAPASFQIIELDAPPMARPFGPFGETGRRSSPKRLHEMDASNVRIPFVPPQVPVLAAGNVARSFATGLPGGWGIGYDLNQDKLWIGNLVGLGGDDQLYGFLPDGTPTGEVIDTTSYGNVFAADIAYDIREGLLWQVNVGGDNCIHAVDPVAQAVTGRTICPAFGTSQRGLAYDPVTDTFYTGSWNDGSLVQFDKSGTILRSMNVGLDVAGLAYNPTSGHLFVLTNSAPPQLDVYVVDTATDFTILGGFELLDGGVPAFSDFEQAGLELDCEGNLYAVNQARGEVIIADSGESAPCITELAWLDVMPTEGVVPANSSTNVTLSFLSQGLVPGQRTGQLLINTDTPYAVPSVPVFLTIAFRDVSAEFYADPFIHALSGAGITAGCGAGNFCPQEGITRANLAVWLLRAKFGADYDPPQATGLVFDDVSPESYAADWIEALAAEGISAGCGGNNFCPNQVVKRRDMAVLILRTLEGAGYMPPPAEGIFNDVPDDPFRPWIEELYRRDITSGCGGNNFCPEDDTLRAEMAVFVVRAFNLPIFFP